MLYAPPRGVSSPSGHNRVAAALFAFLLGWCGVHKFYLGKIGQGVLYALFFWTGIPAIIGFVEGIIYLTKSDQEFAEDYD
jgi:TM2 domain-containing membrane protein YozV